MICLYNHNIWGNMPEDACISNRNGLIRDMIFELAPDFCNFQECNPKTSRALDNAIQNLISDRYAESNAAHAVENFTPVFYNKNRFKEIDGGFIPFEGLNDKKSKSVTWGLFEDKNDGKRVVVISTHFWWKATGEIDELQRAENASKVKEVCDSVLEKHGELPIIVSGDLNSGINSPQGTMGYDTMIKNGFSDVRYTAEVSTDCHTLHPYPILNGDGIYLPHSAMPDRTIDYVFTYGKKLTVKEFSVLADDRARASSDHCPLVARFEI